MLLTSNSHSKDNNLKIDKSIFSKTPKFIDVNVQTTGCYINVQYKSDRVCGNVSSPESFNTLINLHELNFDKTLINGDIVTIEYKENIKNIINESIKSAELKYPNSKARTSADLFSISVERSSYQLLLAKSNGIKSQFSRNTCEGVIKQRNLVDKIGFYIKEKYSQNFLEKLKLHAEKYCR